MHIVTEKQNYYIYICTLTKLNSSLVTIILVTDSRQLYSITFLLKIKKYSMHNSFEN